jgi:hypothetical protein
MGARNFTGHRPRVIRRVAGISAHGETQRQELNLLNAPAVLAARNRTLAKDRRGSEADRSDRQNWDP